MRNPKFEIEKMTVIWTGHVTEHDGWLLRRNKIPHFWAKHEYGTVIWLPSEANDMRRLLKEFNKFGFSYHFVDLVGWAYDQGIKYISFDCDGVEYDKLPRFNW